MTRNTEIARIESGVRNLDQVFMGGLPKGSVIVVSGPPGSGKTIFTQQICFHNASAKSRVLYFSTLSEPTAKTLRYLRQFTFFDKEKLEEGMTFVDLGAIMRSKGLEEAAALIMEHVKRVKPAIVVIDSFKVFDDLAQSKEDLRKFGYEIAVSLMAWETTAFLLGEYASIDYEHNPLFSIFDGQIILSQRESSGEQQRFFQMLKMRGTDHSRDEHVFVITSNGVEMFAPRATILREPSESSGEKEPERCKTHIAKLDEILGPGIPYGSSLLLGGVAGTGKTVLSLEFLYRGAMAGEKGIMFSFEETAERLLAAARGLGWDLDREVKRGMVEIIFIPQPDIIVETHIFMIRERVKAMKAKRVVLDSVSVFLHKVKDPQISREKMFHLCTIVQNEQAVGFFATDIPYGSPAISRFGVEETVVDGVVLLSSLTEGSERQRYIEVYKLRNTAHLKGRHNMTIGPGGVSVFPRYGEETRPEAPPPPIHFGKRLASGIPGLDPLLGGGLLEQSITLVSGSAGIGKSTLGVQFILEGATTRQSGLFVSLEEGPDQLIAGAEALGLPLRAAVAKGTVDVLYLSREHILAGQYLSALDDKIHALKARRLVLDAATHMISELMAPDELRHLLYKLVARFKSLGVTSLLTLEAPSLHSTDSVTGRGLSPIADNLIMLRYAKEESRIEPTLTVVKTRGSAHDYGNYSITIGEGGMRVGPRMGEPKSLRATQSGPQGGAKHGPQGGARHSPLGGKPLPKKRKRRG
jgi:circadian clock protein KaiC